jgi:hypothetical protein
MIFPESYGDLRMAKTFERPNHPERVPAAPAPSAASARDGMEDARMMARRYLPDAIRLLAGIALSPNSEAGLYNKYLAAKEIVAIAGAIPTPAPPPPPAHEGAGHGSEPE